MQATTNQTPKWLDLFITAFGTQGLIALAWWAGAFHAQRIRELQATYPILQITGGAGAGKSTLVANLWKLAGSCEQDENLHASCTMGALLAILARAVNRPVVLEESGHHDAYFDWKMLRECYTSAAIVRRSGKDAIEGAPFRGALAFVGGYDEVLNPRIVNIHLELRSRTAEGRYAIEALHALQITDLTHFIQAVRANREQVIYRLGHVPAYTENLSTNIAPGLSPDVARNHAQLLALLDLLNDLFHIPAQVLHHAINEVSVMAWVHADTKGAQA